MCAYSSVQLDKRRLEKEFTFDFAFAEFDHVTQTSDVLQTFKVKATALKRRLMVKLLSSFGKSGSLNLMTISEI